MSAGWKAWSAALAASAAIHAAVAVNFGTAPEVEDTGAAGPPATISGSLASVLGGVARPGEVVPQAASPVTVVAARPVEAAHSVGAARAAMPERAAPVAPTPAEAAGQTVERTASSAPVVPEVARPAPVSAVTPQGAEPVTASSSAGRQQGERGEVVLPTKAPERAKREASPNSDARKKRRAPETRKRERGEEDDGRTRQRRQKAASGARAGSDRAGAAGVRRASGGRHSDGAGASAIRSYGARVRQRILGNRPAASGVGRAVVSFGLSPSGQLAYARLARSSGSGSIDGAALAAVRRSSPFPAPPAGATARQLRFTISFDFR